MPESMWRRTLASVNSAGRRRASAEELRGGDGELALAMLQMRSLLIGIRCSHPRNDHWTGTVPCATSADVTP